MKEGNIVGSDVGILVGYIEGCDVIGRSDGDEDGLERPESIIAGHMVSANDSIKHVTSVLQLAKHRLILWQLNELIASVEQFERDTIS